MKNRIFVIGGGSSIKESYFSLLKNEDTISTNKTIFSSQNPNYFITTDYSFLIYLKHNGLYDKWKSLPCHKIFVANLIADHMVVENGIIKDKRCNVVYDLEDFDQTIECYKANSVGYDTNAFNSGYNSGFCAFQYALIKGYTEIYLLGMDMKTGITSHFHSGYGWSKEKFDGFISNYVDHFRASLKTIQRERPDIKVYSCSDISLLNNTIKYKNLKDVL